MQTTLKILTVAALLFSTNEAFSGQIERGEGYSKTNGRHIGISGDAHNAQELLKETGKNENLEAEKRDSLIGQQ